MTFEELMCKIDTASEKYESVALMERVPVEGSFDRFIDFSVKGVSFQIEWYTNICYFMCNGMVIPFNKLSFNGNWPNSAKTNLVLRYKGATAMILPVEEYPKVSE